MPTISEVNTTISQPINNLVAFGIILSLVIVLIIIIAAWKGAPAVYRLFKQQAETNAQNAETTKKLTEIAVQNAEQARLAMHSVDKNTAEMVRQTQAIEKQTGIVAIQGRDLRSYQALVSDNLSTHTEQIASNTANIEALKTSIEDLSLQIKAMLEATNLAGVEQIIRTFRDEIIAIIQQSQAQRATGTHPIVSNGASNETKHEP